MKKIFTIFSAALISLSAFAATEQAWYNDVTSISANGKYYIYSVNGAGFMQAGNEKIQAVTSSNYNTTNGLVFTITSSSEGVVTCDDKYLYSYQAGNTCGPVHANGTDKGTSIIWTLLENGAFWNIHSLYTFMGNRYAALYYKDNKYDAVVKDKNPISQNKKETYTDAEYQWYVISTAHFDRHFAIYFFDAYKETVADYTKYEGKVPTTYYNSLKAAYEQTFSVKTETHTAEVVNAAKASLESLYTGAEALVTPYANAKAAIKALEDVADKGDGDLVDFNTDINNAKTALDQAMTVEAINASTANLKAIDPVTINVTVFDALTSVIGAAASENGRTITYAAEDNTIINAEGLAIHKGTTNLIATAAATDTYYEFVRKAEVTVNAINNEGNYNATVCAGEPVVFQSETFTETTTKDFKLQNTTGGDSIVHFSLIVYPTDTTELNDTLKVGESLEVTEDGWTLNEQNVPVDSYLQQAEAKFDLIKTEQNIHGCDSVIVLHVVVEAAPTNPTGMNNITTGERAHKEFHNGVLYIRRGESLYTITGAKAE